MRLFVLMVFVLFSSACNASEYYLELKDGRYQSEMQQQGDSSNYKLWSRVSCHQPHHIEVIHVQRFDKQYLQELDVKQVCEQAFVRVFDRSPPILVSDKGPYLRWFWPDDDEYKQYGAVAICYLHEGDAFMHHSLSINIKKDFDLTARNSLIIGPKNNSNGAWCQKSDHIICDVIGEWRVRHYFDSETLGHRYSDATIPLKMTDDDDDDDDDDDGIDHLIYLQFNSSDSITFRVDGRINKMSIKMDGQIFVWKETQR